ncbi:PREDICTED: uncharacterized protein LOC106814920 [Priapulus caudatus]|uniref:Uncharacterized protein LOC106814920 n=1 Tax=Priapulus caudatus TaxID=37621 RepID=A0ABM1ERG8_PRICU|nr:PREDICTED: uncharacterized protein LOC106814920 [Priapulus caudatus]
MLYHACFAKDTISSMTVGSLGGSFTPKRSKLARLDPVVEDGLLKVGGRLQRSNVPQAAKHQVIVPKESHVAGLILRQVHVEVGHSGRNHMLARLHERYWIASANSMIRKLVGRCVHCRRRKGKRGEQKMADLPTDRILPDKPPFSRVGVDYIGNFKVKRERSIENRYGVIFTCLTTQAIHIEVSHSLDTGSYINAMRKFIAHRGQVVKMRSDNGTNFVGAKKELKDAVNGWNKEQIHNTMLQLNVDWEFNPPASGHRGVWERLIRSIRKVLESTLREQRMENAPRMGPDFNGPIQTSKLNL